MRTKNKKKFASKKYVAGVKTRLLAMTPEARTMVVKEVMSGVSSNIEEYAKKLAHDAMTSVPSILFGTLYMYDDVIDRVHYYLDAHGTRIGKTSHIIGFKSEYVEPESQYRDIAFKQTSDGTNALYAYKGTFVIVRGTNVHYVRGTLDVSEFLDSIAAFRIEHNKKSNNRYYITHKSGSSGGIKGRTVRTKPIVDSEDYVTEASAPDGNGTPIHADMGREPIKWRRDQLVAPVPTSPFDNVAVCPNFNLLRKEAKIWMDNADWYKTRFVPWRYSAFVYGPPGSGKSTSIRALAQELGIPIMTMDLSSMDNDDLRMSWNHARSQAPHMVLFEDIDRLFNEKKELESSKTDITLDALLNVMSGIEPSDGIICLMTANSLVNIDAALLRPGRTDVQIEVGFLTEEGIRKIVQRILRGYDHEIDAMVELCRDKPHTGAEVERRCQARAIQMFWENARN